MRLKATLVLCLLSLSTEVCAGDFAFTSGIAEYDEAYLKALHVITTDIKAGKFMAGESWDQVWTRDTSYSVDLACGLVQPKVSKSTLMAQVEEVEGIGTTWYQDKCGHFGGWPALTDAIVGATGAWSLYRTTGDRDLLDFGYRVTVNSLKRAERDVFDPPTGLFKGCSSFMESNSAYPKKYASNGALLAKTKALSTNLLYYNGYKVASEMARILNKDVGEYERKAEALKQAINKQFWMPERGYYGYFQDEDGKLMEKMEGSGEAFAILFDVAGDDKKSLILKNTPVTPNGLACQWPQYPEWMDYNQGESGYYHNGMIWPFVQGYWGWAAASQADAFTFNRELEAFLHSSRKSDTFMEFYRPEDSFPDGSRRQLWSASGFLSMVYHGLFGMSFDSDGIRFSPVVPEQFTTLVLDEVSYRQMKLKVVVKGHGTKIKSFQIDGERAERPFLAADATGAHTITIDLTET